jgi:hypothetical protein
VGNPVQDVLSAMAYPQGNKPVFVGSASAHQVIACTLQGFSAATVNRQSVLSVEAQSLAEAEAARDLHANELLANPYIRAVGVGASLDHPGEPAVFLAVDPSQPRVELPAVLEGVRTRIVRARAGTPKEVLDEIQSAALGANDDSFSVGSIVAEQLALARTIHANHADEWMRKSGVQGFGITSSADAPSEAALMIFLIRGVPHDAIPPIIDGVRTRVRESSRFRAGFGDTQTQRGCSAQTPGKARTKLGSGPLPKP